MEGTIIDWLTEHVIALMIPLCAVATPVVTLWYKQRLDKKDKKPHSVAVAVEKTARLEALCLRLMERLGAQRVNVWLFHNGGYYYTGEPIQKLSMVCEKNEEGMESIIHIFQNQPISIFQRNLAKLKDNEYFYEYNEMQYKDSLAVLNNLYDIVSSGLFKLKNKDNYFAGILAIGYNNHHAVTGGEVEIIKEASKQIEVELANHHHNR